MLKLVIIFACTALVVAYPAGDNKGLCAGCANTLKGRNIKDAENVLNKSLAKLAAGTGPYYRVGKINSASTQLVSGILYKINADLIESENKKKTCDITIYSQPWLENGIEVTFNCPGEVKVVRRHSA